MNKFKFNSLLKHPGYNFGGGGGTTTSTSYTSNLPEYAKPYFEDIMGRAQEASLTPYQRYSGERVAGFTPYQRASQQMTADIAESGTPTGMQAGQQLAGLTAGRLAGFNYNPRVFDYQQINAPQLQQYQMDPAQQVQAGRMGYQDVAAARMDPAQQVYSPDMRQFGDVYAGRVSNPNAIHYDRISSGQLGPQLDASSTDTVKQFMSPYQQQVVDVEKQAAAREYQIADQMRKARATRAGAFGGSRQAVESAEAERSLMSQLQGIQSKGSLAAYEQAQQALQAQRSAQMQAGTTNIQSALQAAQANQQIGSQANTRYVELSQQAQQLNQQAELTAAQGNQQQANQMYARAAELNQQAQMANQQAGLTVGQQNLQAQMEAQRLNQAAGLTAGQQNLQAMMEAQRLNQQAGLTVGQQNLQALLSTQQLGAQNYMQAATANQQAYADAQRQTEASRQFGATSGLQALQQLGTQAHQLSAMGEAEQKAALERAQALGTVGREQQALQQQQLDQAYSDFAAQRDYEQNMINWYNNILRGVPVSMNQSVYQTTPSPSMASQVAGLGIAGLGAYNALKYPDSR